MSTGVQKGQLAHSGLLWVWPRSGLAEPKTLRDARAMPQSTDKGTKRARYPNNAATRWKPGMPSPNPGGRPNVVREVRQLAQQYAPDAIRRLVTLLHSEDDRVCVAAAQALLDRALGKPEQAISVAAGPTLPLGGVISPEDAATVYTLLMAAEPGSVDLSAVRFLPAPTEAKP